MNELTLGMHSHRTSTNNKILSIFNPYELNNLPKCKYAAMHHITKTTTTNENKSIQQQHVFWN